MSQWRWARSTLATLPARYEKWWFDNDDDYDDLSRLIVNILKHADDENACIWEIEIWELNEIYHPFVHDDGQDNDNGDNDDNDK